MFSFVAGVTRNMFIFLKKMKRKMMVAEAFVFFFLLHSKSMVEARSLL